MIVTITPSSGSSSLPSSELIKQLADAETVIIETVGGRVPQIVKIVKEGTTVFVMITN